MSEHTQPRETDIERLQCALDAVMDDWFECRMALAYLEKDGGLDPIQKKVATAGLCANESAPFLAVINLRKCREVRAALTRHRSGTGGE